MFLANYPGHKLRALRKFPRLRNKNYVAYVKVSEQSGVGVISTSKHVDLWFAKEFMPSKNIERIKRLKDYEPS